MAVTVGKHHLFVQTKTETRAKRGTDFWKISKQPVPSFNTAETGSYICGCCWAINSRFLIVINQQKKKNKEKAYSLDVRSRKKTQLQRYKQSKL
jgi:hypothetical protein